MRLLEGLSLVRHTVVASIGALLRSTGVALSNSGQSRRFPRSLRMARLLAASLGASTALPAAAMSHDLAPTIIAPQLPVGFRLEYLPAADPSTVAQEQRIAFPSVCLTPGDCLGRLAPDDRTAYADPDDAEAGRVPLAYGPVEPGGDAPSPDRSYRSFGSQVGAVKWEMGAVLAYYTAINGPKLFEDPVAPHFHREGWFGESTRNVGMDKLAHAYSAYVISDLLYARLKRKTDNAPGIQYTAAALATATMLYTEFWDSIEESAGWSWEDVAFNTLGSGFSILHNSVPGLDRKLDFRLMIVPNSNFINVEGKRHFEQQRYFFAFKFAGFEAFENSPLRLLELHLGYYGRNFTNEDRAMGIRPDRRIFVGIGINLRELFFRNSRSRVGRAAGEVLDYFQPPYTAIHTHITN